LSSRRHPRSTLFPYTTLFRSKFNFFVGLNLHQRKSLSEGYTYRENLYANKLQNTILNQSSNSTNTGQFLFGRIGFDYLMDNRNSFTLSMSLPNGQFNSSQADNIHIDTMSSPVKTQDAIRTTINKRNFKNFGPALGYKHLVPKQGRELTADFNYNSSSNSGSGNYSTQYYDGNGSSLGEPALQRLISSGSNTFWTVQ